VFQWTCRGEPKRADNRNSPCHARTCQYWRSIRAQLVNSRDPRRYRKAFPGLKLMTPEAA
jgi:hypothetical protein